MADLNKLGLADARDALRKGDVTSAELTAACLSAIEGAGALNAFVHHTGDLAMDQAKAADARIKSGDAPAMCGLPIGIKDLFCTKGVPSQAASRILEGFLPEYESTVSQNLLDSGAVMLGKLNMDEFAMGSSNETSVYGNAVNPWRRSGDETALTPGGSLSCGPRHRYRRLDPPACGLYRHRGDQADLRPLLPLGRRGLCLVAGSGGPDDQDGARCRDHAGCHGGV